VFATGSVLVSIMLKDGKRDGDQREMCVEPRSCEHQNKGEAGLRNFSERSHRSSDETGKIPGARVRTRQHLFPAKTVSRWRHVFGGKGKAVVARVATQIANHPAHLAHFCDEDKRETS
jgi:hypothetical protein